MLYFLKLMTSLMLIVLSFKACENIYAEDIATRIVTFSEASSAQTIQKGRLKEKEIDNIYEILDKVINKIKSSQTEFTKVIQNIEEKKESYQAYAEEALKETNTLQDKSNSNIVDEWLDNYQRIKDSSCPINQKGGLKIFVSFSLPGELLMKLDQTARQLGAELVICGLKHNSLKETVNYLQHLNINGLSVQIDPNAFKQFNITQVPAFVLSEDRKYDKLVGNISLTYVLKKFANDGELKQQAISYLRKINHD